jgi:threonine dehydrogenase-like Zn-dependent dehydrogenase
MRAVVLSSQQGALRPVFADDVPIPSDIPPDHVRIRVHSASLNPVDGKYDNWKGLMERGVGDKDTQRFVLGVDGAGVIDALGSMLMLEGGRLEIVLSSICGWDEEMGRLRSTVSLTKAPSSQFLRM